jgi:hypothetical protein
MVFIPLTRTSQLYVIDEVEIVSSGWRGMRSVQKLDTSSEFGCRNCAEFHH